MWTCVCYTTVCHATGWGANKSALCYIWDLIRSKFVNLVLQLKFVTHRFFPPYRPLPGSTALRAALQRQWCRDSKTLNTNKTRCEKTLQLFKVKTGILKFCTFRWGQLYLVSVSQPRALARATTTPHTQCWSLHDDVVIISSQYWRWTICFRRDFWSLWLCKKQGSVVVNLLDHAVGLCTRKLSG